MKTRGIIHTAARSETRYVTLNDREKLQLLQDHALGVTWKSLKDKKWCLHCDQHFDGQSVRVWQDGAGDYWLECGTSDCNGSPVDWADKPWWRSEPRARPRPD